LPFQLRLLAGSEEYELGTLHTKNISKAGLCFLAPRGVEPGESIEVQVTLAGYGPQGGDLNVTGQGYIVRSEAGEAPGSYQLAAAFQEAGDGPLRNQLATMFNIGI
jgi:hypothetical protein